MSTLYALQTASLISPFPGINTFVSGISSLNNKAEYFSFIQFPNFSVPSTEGAFSFEKILTISSYNMIPCTRILYSSGLDMKTI